MKFIYLFPLFVCTAVCVPVTYDQRQDGEVNVIADLQNFVIIALVPKIGGNSGSILEALSSLSNRKELKTFGGKDDQDPELEPEFSEEREAPHARIDEAFVKQKPYQVDISKNKPSQRKPESPELRSSAQRRNSPPLKSDAVESPVPNVLPVKNNQYVVAADRKSRTLEDVVDINAEVSGSEEPSFIEDNDTDEEAAPVELLRKDARASGKDSGLLLLGASEQCGPDQYRDSQGICQLF